MVTAIHRLARPDGGGRREDNVGGLGIIIEVRGSSYRFYREGIVDKVLGQTEGDNVVRHCSRVGPHALELSARIGHVVRSRYIRAIRGARRNVAAVFVLNSGPGGTAKISPL